MYLLPLFSHQYGMEVSQSNVETESFQGGETLTGE